MSRNPEYEFPMSKPKNDELVVKANALAEAAYSLTTAEQKVILSAITQLRRDEELTDDALYSIEANALADMGGFAAKHEYRNLKDAVDRLFNRYLTVYENPNGGSKRVSRFRWVQRADYISEEGRVEIRFTKDVLPYLNQLSSHFLQYRFKAVEGMTSNYGVRLYELLIQWRQSGEREVSIDWLRERWMLQDKYQSIKDFKKYVVERAVSEINKHSDLAVDVGYRKTGRRVSHVQFQFGPKPKQKEKKAVAGKARPYTRKDLEKQSDLAKPGETFEAALTRLNQQKMEL